ncbi:MAG: FAD-binding oxidoreductase, partial [Sulfobacillus sp.]
MSWLEELGRILAPGQLTTAPSVLEQHAHDESYHPGVLPDVVAFPESEADVVAVMRLAGQHRVPVVAFGVGSGLEGHVVPVRHGISLDTSRLNRVLEIRASDFLARVQPGVTRNQLNQELGRHGLFFPVDPGANASLGGMAATGASGTTTVRYGAMREHVRGLTVVLADGVVIHTGSLAAKSSSGYDLTHLFVGSEGTLGIFTELWLKVWGIPEATLAARAEFETVEQAVAASTAIIGAGVAVVRMELVDAPFFQYINAYAGTTFPLRPTLLLEFRGSRMGAAADLAAARELVMEEGCAVFDQVQDSGRQSEMWEARHSAAFAFMAAHPGRGHLATDVCVPVSKLPQAVSAAKVALTEMGIEGAILGHVGDGNFHVSLAVDAGDPEN